ncbi:MAG: transcription antitermination factor NusB, partial [Clostridiales bacterium]|nr:transcription antitermination factor NusB [Clostridiales bacterium]MBR6484431.1 transcription antitermination factor NusB [Clostridiales bacterium]
MSRIETRESAVFFIYQFDFRSEDIDTQIKLFLKENPHVEEDLDYFDKTVRGVIASREELDEKISGFLKKWTINRIPKLDKAILETACFEILNFDDIPVSVSINEAVRLSKRYGTDDSSSYINGVLSSFEKSL